MSWTRVIWLVEEKRGGEEAGPRPSCMGRGVGSVFAGWGEGSSVWGEPGPHPQDLVLDEPVWPQSIPHLLPFSTGGLYPAQGCGGKLLENLDDLSQGGMR